MKEKEISMIHVIEEVEDFYKVIPLLSFRKTPGVEFDIIPGAMIPRVDGVDRVIHTGASPSPGPVGGVLRPWYMHTHQDDHLMVLDGVRSVELYTPDYGEIFEFEVSAHKIIRNGECICDDACILAWPCGVFHRVQSDPINGSISINLATRHDGIDMENNFSIYDVDIIEGTYHEIRKGSLDQFS